MSVEGFKSLATFLPLQSCDGELRWNSKMRSALIAVARGHPTNAQKQDALEPLSGKQRTSPVSNVVTLCDFLRDLRQDCDLEQLHPQVFLGISSFFEKFELAAEFFTTTLPKIATLALELPSLLKSHEGETGYLCGALSVPTQLRVLHPQECGIVVLRQHLIAALLACGFLCLYPERMEQHSIGLSTINFDDLYMNACGPRRCCSEKLRCLLNYFTRDGFCLTNGWVSFERKVLPLQHIPADNFWSDSTKPLCQFKVEDQGRIEEAGPDFLKVDFADKQLGGETLRVDFAQEEVLFMLHPECIAGMLFIPTISDNESIEIVGSEMVTNYSGYQDTFTFLGDHEDHTRHDDLRRRQTHIVAIDALCMPGIEQFQDQLMIRELNKAYCGFSRHSTLCNFKGTSKLHHLRSDGGSEDAVIGADPGQATASCVSVGSEHCQRSEISVSSTSCPESNDIRHQSLREKAFSAVEVDFKDSDSLLSNASNGGKTTCKHGSAKTCHIHEKELGVAAGNWGSGVFGGDLQLKSMLQWLAASQAGCPSMIYYSFGDERAQGLQEVVDSIRKQEWSVSELWNTVKRYAESRVHGKVHSELFEWISQLDGHPQ